MVKLQQYYIFKFETDRLKDENYNLNISIQEARRNGELISIGDSQMLRSLRRIKNQENIEEKIYKLLGERNIARKDGGKSKTLYEIERDIDKILFVPEIISLVVKNIKQYEYIIKNGLFINNKKFVRLMCSAGQARRNNVLLIDHEYESQLKEILNNGRKDIEITPAKFNAYFALASSTALPVTTPYFCVVPDCEITRKENVEWVEEIDGEDDRIYEIEKDIEINLFDGQGLISPRMAQQWSEDLELDYIPSCFIIRSNFIKGMVCTFDFVKFSDEIGEHFIEDIYGNKVNIRDMDVILSKSQFKLWNAYDSLESYKSMCTKNHIGWGVTRCSPKEENSHTFLNYQFLQVLNLSDEQIEGLCKKTVDYFKNISENNYDYTLLYLLGSMADKGYDSKILNKIQDPVTRALILNPELIDDPYVQTRIARSLSKKIKDSYIGKLIVDGQYTFMVSDPFAMAQHIFNLPVTGLLNRDEYYSDWWNNKGIDKIVGMRSPLTWRGEVDVLNLKTNDEMKEWYKYLNNCCIFNVHGMDMAILGGADL